ncbi:MAG TPA: preprotein translocase subunit YajC [Candidatus Paceibacterota bacterium]|nr:preprotein translocase subunit YajC [Verrucomicrobiota bacterium]HOX00754.1 preprotein translocase subunit YajC [Verrucomicrobiota bacterium]HRZ45734.1 preprotein translocase subunit YajC [Candidatus Paceibacterota bacterium]HRZ94926.1 preprotein translocase subunit YajC [Candidatus Paceibacterota bacterium]
MNNWTMQVWMAMAPPAGTSTNPTGDMLKMLGTMAFFMLVLYLLMIRPQQKKAREHTQMVKSLRPGDKVVVGGGIMGVVVGVKEKSISVRSAESKLEVLRSAVTEIVERAEAGGES